MRKLYATILALGLLAVMPGCATMLLCQDIGQNARAGHPEFLLEMPVVPLAVATDIALSPIEIPAAIVLAPLGKSIGGRY